MKTYSDISLTGLPSHSVILKHRWPFLYDQLQIAKKLDIQKSDPSKNHPVLMLNTEIQGDILDHFLRYVYGIDMGFLKVNFNTKVKMLDVSIRYKFDRVVNKCLVFSILE